MTRTHSPAAGRGSFATRRHRAGLAALVVVLATGLAGVGYGSTATATTRATAATAATAATTQAATTQAATTQAADYRVPVTGAVLRAFDPPDVPWGSGHRGVDLAAGTGDPVRAPAAGVVTFAGRVAGRGVLTLLHEDGLRSSFEPVTSALHPGDRVRQGDVVAAVDDAGAQGHCAPTTCLHWGVRRGDTYVDPLALVATDPIVLLPPA